MRTRNSRGWFASELARRNVRPARRDRGGFGAPLAGSLNGEDAYGERHRTTRSGSAARGAAMAYPATDFGGDEKGIYDLSYRDREFQRLARFDLESLLVYHLTTSISLEIGEMRRKCAGTLRRQHR